MKSFRRLFLYATLFITLISVSACCKLACSGTDIFISLQNYKRLETDTLIFLSYERNTNFAILIDSTMYGYLVPLTDTSKATDAHTIYPDKDWIIKIPSVNKEFRFSDFNISTARCSCGNYKYALVKSYKVNGQLETSLYYNLPR